MTGGHSKLSRTRGKISPIRQKVQFSLLPELIYSDERENNNQQSNHQRLIRKNNVLAELAFNTGGDKMEQVETECEEAEEEDNTETEVEDQSDETDHYKSVRTGENIYSYAYRDAFSPAALIKLDDGSEVSEDVYDSIKAPSDMSKVDIMSDTASEAGDMFLSIR